MVTGEIASRTIEIYNFFVFQRQLVDGVIEKPVYPTFNPVNIQPDYEGMSIMPGRPAVIKQGTNVPTYHLTAQKAITVAATHITYVRIVYNLISFTIGSVN